MRLSMSFAFALSANSGVNPCKWCFWRVNVINQQMKHTGMGAMFPGRRHRGDAEPRIFYCFRGSALLSGANRLPLMQLLEEGGGSAQIAGIVTFGKLGINGREL